MKKSIFTLVLLFITLSIQAQRWSETRAQVWYQQQPWLVGCNYIPATAVNQIEMWSAEKRFNEYINYPEVEKWRNLGGIRNEEDYLITETGHKLLGNPVSKEILNVEKMRQ